MLLWILNYFLLLILCLYLVLVKCFEQGTFAWHGFEVIFERLNARCNYDKIGLIIAERKISYTFLHC